jgi:transcriptional regulator with XRE-family HTH domain
MGTVKHCFLASKLRELRGEESLYGVSKASGISRGTLYRYEKGTLVPEDSTLEKLAKYYDVPFRELKKLMFADFYPEQSYQREILIEWVKELLDQSV